MTAFAFGNRRAAADALLAREYDERKPEVVTTVAGKLAGAGIRLDPSDLDAAYNQAWHALHTKLADGEAIDNPTGLLVAITHRRALDEHRALHVNRRADADDLELIAHEHDIDQRLDDEMQLRQFLAGLRERLNRRELQAAALCYVYEYSRPEAARLVGVPPKRMEKIMDAVSRKLAPVLVEIRSGTWCEQHSSLMKAFALGLLEPDGERYALARDHLEDCSACRRSILRTRGIGAVAPPVPLALGAAGVFGAGVSAAGRGSADGGSAESGRAGSGRGGSQGVKLAAAAAAVLALALAALALAIGGGSEPSAPAAPSSSAREGTAAAAGRARAERASAGAAARARARARASERRRAAAARRRAAARRPVVAPAAPSPQPTAATSSSPPATAPDPPAADPPAAEPPTPDPPAPKPGLVRDGAEEFELR